MVFFVSDMHFGQGSHAEDRAIEDALIACLQAHAHKVTQLFLVGDVFDGFIEYRQLVPKGFVRFMALLAAWTDRGVSVTYLVGNHDPWHQDYFATELGVHVMHEPLLGSAGGAYCCVMHGDGLGRARRGHRILRRLLRNRTMVQLYRSLLPADVGVSLAHRVSRRLHQRRHNPRTVDDMRRYAQNVLQQTAAEVLVMGHSHRAELCPWPRGIYMNLGSWRDEGTFGVLDAGIVQLKRWRGNKAALIAEHEV